MKKWFTNLSPLMQFVVAILVLFVIYYVLKNGSSFFQTLSQKAQLDGETKAYEKQGMKRSYTDSQYASFATKLYNAMDGMGTSEDAIMSVFSQMNNDIDIINLEKKFGLRASSYAFGFGTPTDLQDWLSSDLSDSALAELNNILASKGINRSY